MTWPLTFSSPPVEPVEAYRARNDVVGDRMLVNLEMGARGSYGKKSVNHPLEWQQRQDIRLLTVETQSYWREAVDASRIKMSAESSESRGGSR